MTVSSDTLGGGVTGERHGAYLILRDQEGLMHIARLSSLSLASQIDPLDDEWILVVSGRPIRVSCGFDDVLEWLDIR